MSMAGASTAASLSSFDMVEGTPKSVSSSATEDMRKLALGVAPGSSDARAAEMLEDLERKSKGGKVLKSRCLR
eukprot:2553839-Rhodomonas_salina.1